jgi:hypothetical protein
LPHLAISGLNPAGPTVAPSPFHGFTSTQPHLVSHHPSGDRGASHSRAYKDVIIEGAYRLDVLVENEVVVEIKAIDVLLPVHHAQLLSYLRLANKPVGLLINFHVPVLVKGLKRIMNGCEGAALHSKQPPIASVPNMNGNCP